ncbi:MAG: hypothetical protein SCK57_03710 [Bacillota bacterium]|nr:hypothetical protein [Bacillota bacterium]MDW7676745.1 hypothetical protein [Bacillota bacterium]
MAKRTKGTCGHCGKEYTKTSMSKHILACEERQKNMESVKSVKTAGYFVLLITGKYSPQYWLIVEVKDGVKLKDLDQFLRDIWLECCGHMSGFNIAGVRYESHPEATRGWGIKDRGMASKLVDVIVPGMVFEHEYDYGSTTALTISVLEHHVGPSKKEKVTVLARNHPVQYVCDECEGKPATMICLECAYDGYGFLCDECQQDHACGEEMLSPLYNSPRCGVCGYEGSDKYPD